MVEQVLSKEVTPEKIQVGGSSPLKAATDFSIGFHRDSKTGVGSSPYSILNFIVCSKNYQ